MFCFLFVYVLILWTEKGLHYIYEKSSELCISMTEFDCPEYEKSSELCISMIEFDCPEMTLCG